MDAAILERELVQARLLSAVFSRALKNEVVLKGGMAMRALYGSQRHTKDIDLGQDGAAHSLASLQRLMRRAVKEATQGFLDAVVVTEPKQTDTVARWKIHGRTPAGTDIGLTVEVSRRGVANGHLTHETYRVPGGGMPAVTLDVYDGQAMAASKVFALASETRLAPRDLYDLDLLVRMDVRPDPALFDGIPDRRAFVAQCWRKIELMDWALFEQEVMPYLPGSARSRLDEPAFEAMRIRVGEAIERWLGQPGDEGGHEEPSSIKTQRPRE